MIKIKVCKQILLTNSSKRGLFYN